MEFIPCGDKAQSSIEPTLDTISFIFEQMVCELLLVGDMLRYKPPTPSFFWLLCSRIYMYVSFIRFPLCLCFVEFPMVGS